jgi:hypothetical protein
MKKFLFLVVTFIGLSAFSQNSLQIQKTWDVDAVFDGGKESLQKEINKALEYVIQSNYVVEGKVTLVLQINEDGKYFLNSVYPANLKNKQAFKDDMNYVIKRFKKKWQPATFHGKPVKSLFIYKINFSTMSYDED